MTHHPDQPPNGLHTAPRALLGREGGGRKSDAEGVLSALPPDQGFSGPSAGDSRYIVAWLHICAPYLATPTAMSMCLCGGDRSAVGHRKVHALIADHAAPRYLCPFRATEGGQAA